MAQTPLDSEQFAQETANVFIDLFGVEDMTDLKLHHCFKSVAHLIRHLMGEFRKDGHQSTARIRLLIFLVVHHRLGNEAGVAPSALSDHLGVSRNTVSALLNGLEEQGLIERHLHPEDRRQLLIQITPEGQELVAQRAPVFGQFVTDMFAVLTADERQTLSQLLLKLHEHLLNQAEQKGINAPCFDTDALEIRGKD